VLHTPLASPPVLPASADVALPVDAAETTPQRQRTANKQQRMALCQNGAGVSEWNLVLFSHNH
jgi:hypothetical protein